MWRWDGVRWVPLVGQPVGQPIARPRTRPWIWWLAGGCALLLVIGVVGAGYGIYSIAHSISSTNFACLPSDFPRYPGAKYASFTFDLNGTYPGNTCHSVFESNDDVVAVTAFYRSKLNTGDWQVAPILDHSDTVTFQPAKSDAPFGTVQVAFGNAHTEITIDLFTSTCLPLNFPRYPGAKFGGQNAGQSGVGYACHIVFVSNDSVAAVTAFYKRELNTGNWHVTSSGSGVVGFSLKNGKSTRASGTVAIALNGDLAEVTVDAYH